MNSREEATPMQANWIELDLVLNFITIIVEGLRLILYVVRPH